jgi:hypothetical protein
MNTYPSLYQMNTRVWLTKRAQVLNHPATLDDIPDATLDQLAEQGFDWIWFLGVWETGEAGRQVSLTHPAWQAGFRETLEDLQAEDIVGSCFAIGRYKVHPALGGNGALSRLRGRLHQRGLKLMLDFVPNHTAPDHDWVFQHPDFYVQGSESDLVNAPENYRRIELPQGSQVLAHGKDPYFPGWPDTLQLNYGNPALQTAMLGELMSIAALCDGLRCDMAMLILPPVFQRTWGIQAAPFWPQAIKAVRQRFPEFLFLAEVYWDLEWTLQQQGFDYAYDKRLYDRLRDQHASPVRAHLQAGLDYQNKLARFLENHDEPRAMATFSWDVHQAAAIVTFLTPGLRFFHQGQLTGFSKAISPHLRRGPEEPINESVQQFYTGLLDLLRDPVLRQGDWRLLQCTPAREGNGTWDNFIAFSWQGYGQQYLLVTVNYAPHSGQCRIFLPFRESPERVVRLEDRLSSVVYERDKNQLVASGLYLDMPGWGYHVFNVNLLH